MCWCLRGDIMGTRYWSLLKMTLAGISLQIIMLSSGWTTWALRTHPPSQLPSHVVALGGASRFTLSFVSCGCVSSFQLHHEPLKVQICITYVFVFPQIGKQECSKYLLKLLLCRISVNLIIAVIQLPLPINNTSVTTLTCVNPAHYLTSTSNGSFSTKSSPILQSKLQSFNCTFMKTFASISLPLSTSAVSLFFS